MKMRYKLLLEVPKELLNDFYLLTVRDGLRCNRSGTHFHYHDEPTFYRAKRLLKDLKHEHAHKLEKVSPVEVFLEKECLKNVDTGSELDYT